MVYYHYATMKTAQIYKIRFRRKLRVKFRAAKEN
jgi:hypothetical protein